MNEVTCNQCFKIILLLFIFSFVNVSAEDNELKMVHVIFRHGERTPTNISTATRYPNDPYVNNTYFPVGLGGLIDNGKRSMFKFGTLLREKYNLFLGDIYTPGITKTRSTDRQRTMTSAQLVNAGLWPPSETQQWNKDLPWIPIPYEYVPSTTDSLMTSYMCPAYEKELKRVGQSAEVKKLVESHLQLFAYLSEHTGANITTPQDVFFLYHILESQKNCNLTLPSWAEGYFPRGEMYNVTLLHYDISNWGDLIKKIYGGPLLRDVLLDYEKLIEDTSSIESIPKMKLYSGHEGNICSVLKILGVWTPHIPDFSSAVIFELYLNKSTNEYGIQILYHLGRSGNITSLTLPGCTQICPINEFTSLLSNLIPGNVDRLCQGNITSDID